MHVFYSIDGFRQIEPRQRPVAPNLNMHGSFNRCIHAFPIKPQFPYKLCLMQSMPQILSTNILHLVIERAVVLKSVIKLHDSWVL